MGVQVPRSGDGGGGGGGDDGKKRATRKAAACRLLKTNGAEILDEADETGAKDAACLLGKDARDIPLERLIRLRVGPDKSRARCYDALEIHRRITRSTEFAAHFSPHQRARIATQATFAAPETNGSVAAADRLHSLPSCDTYSSFRTACGAAAPRCSYNRRTFLADLWRRSSSRYAEGECHPVTAYVRQLAAVECGIATATGTAVTDEKRDTEADAEEAGLRASHLRAVLRDILGRAIQKNHLPSVAATDADEKKSVLGDESGGSSDGGGRKLEVPGRRSTALVVAAAPGAGGGGKIATTTTRAEAAYAQYELEQSIEHLKQNLARRLALLPEEHLCRLLRANLQWYLDDTASLSERAVATVRGLGAPVLAALRSIASPYYAAASTSADAFLQLLGWDYVPLRVVQRLLGPALRLSERAVAELAEVAARRRGVPLATRDEDADLASAERQLTLVDDAEAKKMRILGGEEPALSAAAATLVRTVHFVVNSALGVYANVFASYTAYFLLTPGGRALLDKVRRNPSVATASGIVLALLLDASADFGPIRLLQSLDLPPAVGAAISAAVDLAAASSTVAGLVAGDLLAGAPKLAALVATLKDRTQPRT
jgi:hypothetical protein